MEVNQKSKYKFIKNTNNIYNKIRKKGRKKMKFKRKEGITLIALVITILFSYDEKLKCSNSKGFLLATI